MLLYIHKQKFNLSYLQCCGSGSESGGMDPDPDPDPHQNDMDPQHCLFKLYFSIFVEDSYWKKKKKKCRFFITSVWSQSLDSDPDLDPDAHWPMWKRNTIVNIHRFCYHVRGGYPLCLYHIPYQQYKHISTFVTCPMIAILIRYTYT